MKKVNLKELSVFYNDIAKLLFIYNETKSDETIHKYRERYGDNWEAKLKEDSEAINIMSFKEYQEGKNE